MHNRNATAFFSCDFFMQKKASVDILSGVCKEPIRLLNLLLCLLEKSYNNFMCELLLIIKFSHSALEELLSYCKIEIFTYQTF